MTFPTPNVAVQRTQGHSMKRVVWLCSPTVLGFVVFLFSFPLDRPLPFSRLSVFDALFLWSFVAPMFTIAAMIAASRRRFRESTPVRTKIGAWTIIIFAVCLNVFLITGFLAAAYY
jgi:Mn2+/Fe2+ NRAMP family transporter